MNSPMQAHPCSVRPRHALCKQRRFTSKLFWPAVLVPLSVCLLPQCGQEEVFVSRPHASLRASRRSLPEGSSKTISTSLAAGPEKEPDDAKGKEPAAAAHAEQEDGGPFAWLRELNATYSKIVSGEQVTPQDVSNDLDLTTLLSLVLAVFNAYVWAAPPAIPPDCVSYSKTTGACCPSLDCYRDLPYGGKYVVGLALLFNARGAVRNLSNPFLRASSAGVKSLFVLAVQLQVLWTLFAPS